MKGIVRTGSCEDSNGVSVFKIGCKNKQGSGELQYRPRLSVCTELLRMATFERPAKVIDFDARLSYIRSLANTGGGANACAKPMKVHLAGTPEFFVRARVTFVPL